MPFYEHVFVARQDATPQAVETLTEEIKGILEANGGKLASQENWGVRTLAYRIKKNRKAHYTLLNIDAPAPAIAEMERQMRINEDILRFMTVRVDELEEGPSAMLQKRDRDDDRSDRPGGRPGGDRGGFGRGDRDSRPPRRF